jgi:hypothetical protein
MLRSIVKTAVVVFALAGAAPAMATPLAAPVTPSPTVSPAAPTQGIIMRDGGICDPLRHMGC